jgi:hypothetical protein
MLRFDLPQIPANVARTEAFVTFVVCLLALAASWPWLMVLLAVQGFIRGVLGHMKCPAHRLWRHVLGRFQAAGKLEDAGAKMFANKILMAAATVSVVLWLSGSSLWMVPAAVLVVFSFLEWALSFCAACWAYGLWYRARGS